MTDQVKTALLAVILSKPVTADSINKLAVLLECLQEPDSHQKQAWLVPALAGAARVGSALAGTAGWTTRALGGLANTPIRLWHMLLPPALVGALGGEPSVTDKALSWLKAHPGAVAAGIGGAGAVGLGVVMARRARAKEERAARQSAMEQIAKNSYNPDF